MNEEQLKYLRMRDGKAKPGDPIPVLNLTLVMIPVKGKYHECVQSSKAREMIKSNQDRVKEVIQDSLYGIDITNYKISDDYETVSMTITPNEEYIGAFYTYGKGTVEQFKYDITENYDSADDGWREGDITFPKGNNNGELFLEICELTI